MSDKQTLIRALVKLDDSDWTHLLEEVWRERQKRDDEATDEDDAPKGDTDQLARFYARRQLAADPGVIKVFHFPSPPASREVRLLEINALLHPPAETDVDVLEFGVAKGTPDEHRLLVADVTPYQWDAIRQKKLRLPKGWKLSEARELRPGKP